MGGRIRKFIKEDNIEQNVRKLQTRRRGICWPEEWYNSHQTILYKLIFLIRVKIICPPNFVKELTLLIMQNSSYTNEDIFEEQA